MMSERMVRRTVGNSSVVRLERLDASELLSREGDASIDSDPPSEGKHTETTVPAENESLDSVTELDDCSFVQNARH